MPGMLPGCSGRALLRALVVAVVVVAAAVTASFAAEKSRPPGPGPVTAIEGPGRKGDAAFQRGKARERRRVERLRGRQAQARRRATRTRLDDLSRDEALAVARREFAGQLKGDLFDGDQPGDELQVEEQRGEGVARVKDTKSGEDFLLATSLPLQAKTEAGKLAPVDLSLDDTGTTLEPANSLAPFAIDEKSSAAVEFPEIGLRFELENATDRTAQVASDRAFFASVKTDTDAVVNPTTAGVELDVQVRSPDAPERFVIDVDLPAGAALREVSRSDPEGPAAVAGGRQGRAADRLRAPADRSRCRSADGAHRDDAGGRAGGARGRPSRQGHRVPGAGRPRDLRVR